MNVYYSKNLWGRDRYAKKLTPVPLQKTILWNTQELFLPAVYVGEAGAVLDVCEKIPVSDMESFLKKWDRERRLSLKTQEELEQFHAENPGSRDFMTEMSLDGSPLSCRISAGLMWYPPAVFQMTADETGAPYEDKSPALQTSPAAISDTAKAASDGDWTNDKIAEELMDAYGCDRTCCWHFGRISYEWKSAPVLSPQKISLFFKDRPVPVTTGYFTTDLSCRNEKITITHPATGQNYELTILGCEPMQHSLSFDQIGTKGILYPEHSQVLTYKISPEIPDSLFSIRDCSDGDHPRKADTTDTDKEDADKEQKKQCLSSSVFVIGNHRGSDHAAVSSLHFEPVSTVQWRAVFHIKKKADLQISFSVPDVS